MKQGDKTKQLILSTANQLFYQQGFAKTSLNDIVKLTGLSKGNITYHFKSKKDILFGVVKMRNTDIKNRLDSWNNEIIVVPDRLERFCDILMVEQENLIKYGCPMGTLIGELSKNEPELYEMSLQMLDTFRHWLKQQFKQLGFSNNKAEENSLELLSRAQGISAIAHLTKDAEFLKSATTKFKSYIHVIAQS